MRIFKEENRTTLKIQAEEQIRNAIKCGKLKPGGRLVEAELARQMGISRFPIREAISSLDREGLVFTIPFKGSYVSKLEKKDLEEVYSLRAVFEELAIKTLMKNATKEKIERLESIIRDMARALEKKKPDLISEDLRFHKTICELSGHRRLLDMWLTLSDQIRSFLAMEEHFHESIDHLLESHRIILKAIKSGNSRLAQKRIRENVNKGLRNLKRITKS
jgi:DNA-binding GntR family transcriptional regulator